MFTEVAIISISKVLIPTKSSEHTWRTLSAPSSKPGANLFKSNNDRSITTAILLYQKDELTMFDN